MKVSRVIAALVLVFGLAMISGCSCWNREPLSYRSEEWVYRAMYGHDRVAPHEDDFFEVDDCDDSWSDEAHLAQETFRRDHPLPKPGPAPRTKQPRGSGGGS